MNQMYKVNPEKVKMTIKSQGRTGKGVAMLMGMESSTFRSKLSESTPKYGFYENEIDALCSVLSVSRESVETKVIG